MLLGERPNDGDGAMEKGGDWILSNGPVTKATSWGRIWLSLQKQTSHIYLCTLFHQHSIGDSL